jgi:hypothetical protein
LVEYEDGGAFNVEGSLKKVMLTKYILNSFYKDIIDL